MTIERKTKPTIDAVNDAVGALSDLLHSLRAHAEATAREAKPTKAGRGARKAAKPAARGA